MNLIRRHNQSDKRKHVADRVQLVFQQNSKHADNLEALIIHIWYRLYRVNLIILLQYPQILKLNFVLNTFERQLCMLSIW